MSRPRQIIAFMRPFLAPLIVALVLTGLLTFIGMLPPLLMRQLISDVAKEGKWGIFPLVMGLLIAVPLLRAGINVANGIALNVVSRGIIRRTRNRMFSHLMRLSMRFYNETPVGAISQRLMADVAAVSGLVTGGLITLVTDVIAVGFALVVMLRLSLPLSGLTFALLPLYILNYWFFSKRIKRTNVVLRSHMDHISSTLQERLSAHELIQAYGQEKATATHFSSQAKQVMDASVRVGAYNTAFNHIAAFINKLGNTLIYCAGCYFFIKETMDYGDVVAFCAYATSILGPVVRFAQVLNQFTQVGVSIDRINEIVNREPAIKEAADPKPVTTLRGEIAVDGVEFDYGSGQEALRDLQVSVPAGMNIAVVGPTGAGRSTLAMLLRRFYDPDQGEILVDGTDIREFKLSDYRRALALVMPESAIFDGTIRENLCYGKPDVTEDRMVEVSKALGLDEFVASLAEGYDTRLGTGGLKLSAGVRQQIGIARALISDPLILILDEATATLDPETAERAHRAIVDAMEDRTCILIVNRVLMARVADQVVVMDGGQVVETGEHDSLLRRPESLYRDLFGRQYGEDRLPPEWEDEA